MASSVRIGSRADSDLATVRSWIDSVVGGRTGVASVEFVVEEAVSVGTEIVLSEVIAEAVVEGSPVTMRTLIQARQTLV